MYFPNDLPLPTKNNLINTNTTNIASELTAINALQIQSTTNTGEITGIETRLTTVENVSDINISKISNNTTQISINTTTLTNLQLEATNIGFNQAAITTLQTRATNDEANITNNTTQIGINRGTIATNTTTLNNLQLEATNIGINGNAITALQTRATNDETNIGNNGNAITTLQIKSINDEANIATNTANITTLTNSIPQNYFTSTTYNGPSETYAFNLRVQSQTDSTIFSIANGGQSTFFCINDTVFVFIYNRTYAHTIPTANFNSGNALKFLLPLKMRFATSNGATSQIFGTMSNCVRSFQSVTGSLWNTGRTFRFLEINNANTADLLSTFFISGDWDTQGNPTPLMESDTQYSFDISTMFIYKCAMPYIQL